MRDLPIDLVTLRSLKTELELVQILGFKDHIELSQADATDEMDLQGNDSDSEMPGLEDDDDDDDDEDDDDEETEVPGLQRHVTINNVVPAPQKG
jgi:hypothetical protein